MRLDLVHLENLGPIQSIDLPLHPKFNVIVGANGAGKTTILRAISTMLARYASALRTGRAASPFAPTAPIRRGKEFFKVVIEASDGDRRFQWSGGRRKLGSKVPLSEAGELLNFAQALSEDLDAAPDRACVPIVASYPVGRSVYVHLRPKSRERFAQLAALDDSALNNSRDFREFFAWFRDQEDFENERKLDGTSHHYVDAQLEAVRHAISSLLPGFSQLRVRRRPRLELLVNKGETIVRVDQLSDGEKGILALAGDLARRLAMANPGRRNPLEGSGVVLIDELELHLHPAWQRSVVRNLQSTFSNLQFIVTSHSPQVLSEVEGAQVFLLSEGQLAAAEDSYGRDSGLILEELMGTPARPGRILEEISALYELIDERRLPDARDALRVLEDKVGSDDPKLITARLLLRPRGATAS